MPAPGSEVDADKIVAYAAQYFKGEGGLSDEDRSWMKRLAMGLAGQASPVATYIGGAAGQEVLKACIGKFTPLNQWLLFGCSRMPS